MTDRALRMRLDVDVRADDELGLGTARTGPPGPPLRDAELAVVLGTALARVALAAVPEASRASVARDLASLEAADVAADLTARRIPGAHVHELRSEEQVGARGWCARAVLGEGAPPVDAVVSVDPIRLPPGGWTEDWAARVPWAVPGLVGRASGGSADALARAVLALRALGLAVAESPATALDPSTARQAAAEALAVPRPVPGAAAFAPAPPPEAAVTLPVSPPPRPAAPAPPPAAPAPDRRMVAALAASVGLAVLSLVLVFAILVSPGAFGLASTAEVNDRVSVLEAGVSQLRDDVGTLAQQVQGGAGGAPADQVRELRQSVDDLREQVEGLCSVLPVVC